MSIFKSSKIKVLSLILRKRVESQLMIKGISDWADPNKADNLWRDYATDAAAVFAARLIEQLH